jgi:hypothetical protein
VWLAEGTGADQGLLERMLHEPAIVNGMLIVIAVTTLTFAYRNLRHYLRHSPAPAVVSRPRATPWVRPPPQAAAGALVHAEDYPSWPGRPGPTALHPDHPSWPGRPDPRWTAFEEAWADDGPG